MSDQPKLVIVDTNCYVRLYYSPLRPILGQVVGGYPLTSGTTCRMTPSDLLSCRLDCKWKQRRVEWNQELTSATRPPVSVSAPGNQRTEQRRHSGNKDVGRNSGAGPRDH